MRIVIRAEDKGKYVNIPLTIRECRAIYDLTYMLDDSWADIKLNKIENEVNSFGEKIEHLIHDVIDGGRSYSYRSPKHHITIKKGKGVKVIKQKAGYVPIKKRSYIVKKPKWKKVNE